MDNPKAQLIDRLKEANNVLVTVSSNPSIDQLSAAIGLSLVLNKLGKHATAVFSGNVPNTLEFLQPEETLERTTDSLRDFIISLDKTKADKLRYKVEDKHVKIFITPYRTSITQEDLEFSQGDFNVDLVVALGVHEQQDLDQAITAHGRILHDATVAAITTDTPSGLGSINLVDTNASSLCEITAGVVEQLKKDVLDNQMATALLTGIVAETERFSNEKTTSLTMNTSAKLMAAGANQQLVATKLQEKAKETDQPQFDPLKMNELATEEAVEAEPAPAAGDGSLQIDHPSDEQAVEEEAPSEPVVPAIHIDEHGEMNHVEPAAPVDEAPTSVVPSRLILQPPTLGGTLTGSTNDNEMEASTDPMSQPTETGPLLSHTAPKQASEPKKLVLPEPVMPEAAPSPEPTPAPELAPAEPAVLPEPAPEAAPSPEPEQTLTDIEASVESPHLDHGVAAVVNDALTPDVSQARDAVMDAINASPADDALNPIVSLNAQPVDLELPSSQPTPEPAAGDSTDTEFKIPEDLISDPTKPEATVINPTAPPPVPPPMMPPLPGMTDPNELPAPGAAPQDDTPSSSGNPFNLPPA